MKQMYCIFSSFTLSNLIVQIATSIIIEQRRILFIYGRGIPPSLTNRKHPKVTSSGQSCIDPDTLVLPNCSVVLPRDMKTKREESEEIMEQTIHLNAMRSYWDYDDRLNKSDHAK